MLKRTREKKQGLEHRYLVQLESSLLFVLLYCIWVLFVIISIYYFGMGYRWSLLSMDEWIYSGCAVIGFFFVVELVIYLHYRSRTKTYKKEEKTPAFSFQGKPTHIFTYPLNTKGGMFSKTYIPLDNNTLLLVRAQILSPQELWKKKE